MNYHKYIYKKFIQFKRFGFENYQYQNGTDFELILLKNEKKMIVGLYYNVAKDYSFIISIETTFLVHKDVFKTNILFNDFNQINNYTFKNLKNEIDEKFCFMMNRINLVLDYFK